MKKLLSLLILFPILTCQPSLAMNSQSDSETEIVDNPITIEPQNISELNNKNKQTLLPSFRQAYYFNEEISDKEISDEKKPKSFKNEKPYPRQKKERNSLLDYATNLVIDPLTNFLKTKTSQSTDFCYIEELNGRLYIQIHIASIAKSYQAETTNTTYTENGIRSILSSKPRVIISGKVNYKENTLFKQHLIDTLRKQKDTINLKYNKITIRTAKTEEEYKL